MEENNNDDKKAEVDCKTGCLNRMRATGKFIYNSETHEVLGRTWLSWVKILVFYLVFYGVLACFFAICLVVFLKTLDPTAPTQQDMKSMLKFNPGVGFVPQANDDSTLIYFNNSRGSSFNGSSCLGSPAMSNCDFVGMIAEELAKYNSTDQNSKLKNCSFGDGATTSQGCLFDVATQLGSQCSEENDFGYADGRPCVLLKINKVFKWDPSNQTFDTVSCKDDKDTSNGCLLSQIANETRSDIRKGFIPVSCEGENPGDVDNINKVTFYPSAGFPTYYYPYYNQPSGFLPPVVMAQFDVVPNRTVMILCKIWTTQIKHDQYDLQGSIHFELMVDVPYTPNLANLTTSDSNTKLSFTTISSSITTSS
jgi:sodium/potassium-transporting ATPase subunit beta